MLSFLLGIVVASVLVRVGSEWGDEEHAGMKRCPECAEYVQHQARVCRFCGYEFWAPER
jgi:Uncharacterised protein family UPF0547